MVIARLDEIMPKIELPFSVEVSFEIYDNTMSIDIWLPHKTIIPKQISFLASSGRINYKDKTQIQINKQYLEVCAGIIMRVLCAIYVNIPSLDKSCLNCISREGINDEALITLVAGRE